MAENALTLTLEGEVSLEDYADSLRNFSSLIEELSKEIGEGIHIDWDISGLATGSAVTTIAGTAQVEGLVTRVAQAYITIGEHVAAGKPFPYSDRIANRVEELTGVICEDGVSGVIFSVNGQRAAIYEPFEISVPPPDALESVGTITGVVETVSVRGGVKATVYDPIFDKAIRCFLRKEDEQFIINALRHRVVIAGRITRDPETGRALRVRDVRSLKVVDPVAPGSYRKAAGAIPFDPDDDPPEVQIRRMRDAS